LLVAVPLQPLGRRLARLADVPDQLTRESGVWFADEIEIHDVQPRRDAELFSLDLRDPVPDIAASGAELGVGLDTAAELLLPAKFLPEEHGILEPCVLTAIRLQTVLHAEELVADAPLRLRTERCEPLQEITLSLEELDQEGVAVAPLVHELRESDLAARRARVAGDEDEFALVGAVRVEGEIFGRGGRPRAIGLVRPDEGDVEHVARVCEVVEVAAEAAGLQLRREDELDRAVPAIPIQLELTAVEERDGLTPVLRFRLARFGDRPSLRLLRGRDLLGACARRRGALDTG